MRSGSLFLRIRAETQLARFSESWQNATQAADSQTRLKARFELLDVFDRLSSQLYRVRKNFRPEDPFRRRYEDVVAMATLQLLQDQRALRPPEELSFRQRYHQVWKDNFSLFVTTLIIFLVALLLGWRLALSSPDYAMAIVPAEFLELIMDKVPWFESLQSNPLMGGFRIAMNNIQVCILIFSMGALFGLGGAWHLVLNGIFFGAIMGFCYLNDFHEALLGFVLSHGFLEFSIIVSSAFAGFLFGRVFFMRPYKLFRTRFRAAASEGGLVLTGILPWLCLAAFFESFVSPFDFFSPTTKIFLGVLAALAFWIWTLAPKLSKTNRVSRKSV